MVCIIIKLFNTINSIPTQAIATGSDSTTFQTMLFLLAACILFPTDHMSETPKMHEHLE